MKSYRNLWNELCLYKNLLLAFERASKGRTKKSYVLEFQKNLKQNILELRTELIFHSYRPEPLVTFILHDPKSRKISKSHFRDRIVHHAICNIIGPFFEREFIYDSYANRIGKGALKAIQRFDKYQRKVSKNNTRKCFVLKADIKTYFESVDISILIQIIEKKIKDKKVIWLIKRVLRNYIGNIFGKGMPLGNLTSQFFANVYMNELDQFVKHKLQVKYYLRYVDDFVILHNNKITLDEYKENIVLFLRDFLALDLHPTKSKITFLRRGISFLGFRIFPWHKLLKKSNIKKYTRKLDEYKEFYKEGIITYDNIYNSFQGWQGYVSHGDTYKLRTKVRKRIELYFPNEVATAEVNRLVRLT